MDSPEPDTHQEEHEHHKRPFPKGVFFIIINELCERFCYYGMRTVLNLYMRDNLHFSERVSKIVFHSFAATAYFCPLIGATIADGFIGKFKTIIYFSLIYVVGIGALTLGSAIFSGAAEAALSISGLFLIALGTGGIKPCVSSFGADQFHLPQQQHYMDLYFALFYFTINVGSFISTLTTPLMRSTSCLGHITCFPLAFGVPALLMLCALAVFIIGKRFYRILLNTSDVILAWARCVCHALGQKCKSKEKVDHWLDRSTERFGADFVSDVKITFSVLRIFIPIPVFWSLFDQQASAWTFQASRMYGKLGSITILPDQMQIANAFLILAFIPLFNLGVYPAFEKCNLMTKPLTRMALGGVFASIAFFVSGGISVCLEASKEYTPPDGKAFVRFYNLLDSTVYLNADPGISNQKIESMAFEKYDIEIKTPKEVQFTIEINKEKKSSKISIGNKDSIYCFVSSKEFACEKDDLEKDKAGFPKLRTLLDQKGDDKELIYKTLDSKIKVNSTTRQYARIQEPDTGFALEDYKEKQHFLMGAVYVALVQADGRHIKKFKLYEIIEPNKVHILWQLPQYTLITIGEVLLSITALEFAYVQAPKSMKSFVSAFWLLTTAFGNVLVVFIETVVVLKRQSYSQFLYGTIMLLVMVVFVLLARSFKYHVEEDDDDD